MSSPDRGPNPVDTATRTSCSQRTATVRACQDRADACARRVLFTTKVPHTDSKGREEIAMMKISVDTQKCVASGQCVLAAAEVFDQRDDDGTVILLNDSPDPDQYVAVRLAAQMCPASVISVIENEPANS